MVTPLCSRNDRVQRQTHTAREEEREEDQSLGVEEKMVLLGKSQRHFYRICTPLWKFEGNLKKIKAYTIVMMVILLSLFILVYM